MTPTNKRDLHADLEAVEKFENGYIPEGPNDNDRAIWGYFLFAREGWPEAIHRAIAAEAEVERLTNSVANWQWYALKGVGLESKLEDALRELERIVEYGDGCAVDMANDALQRINGSGGGEIDEP